MNSQSNREPVHRQDGHKSIGVQDAHPIQRSQGAQRQRGDSQPEEPEFDGTAARLRETRIARHQDEEQHQQV